MADETSTTTTPPSPGGAPEFQLPTFQTLDSPQSEEARSNAATVTTAAQARTDAKEYEENMFRRYMNLERSWGLNKPPENPVAGVGESCIFKAVTSTAVGGLMGVVVGVVCGTMGGMQPGAMLMPGVPEPPRKGWRHEIRDSMRQTRFKARSWAKNFAFISGVYTGVECVVEKMRGKHDVRNSVGAGCITGAGLAVSCGPQVCIV